MKTENLKQRAVEFPIIQDVFLRRDHPNKDDNNSVFEVIFETEAFGKLKSDVE